MKPLLNLPLLMLSAILASGPAAFAAPVTVTIKDQLATIQNDLVSVGYDLSRGTYTATDKRCGKVILADAALKVADWSSAAPGTASTVIVEPLGDALGLGRSLLISCTVPGGPKLLMRLSLYEHQTFIALTAGLENTTAQTLQIKALSPLDSGLAYAGFETSARFSLLDGNGGGAKTFVSHDRRKRTSRNNLLATFGSAGQNRSLVLGGLGYEEFEKSAELERRADGALAVRLWASDPVGKRVDPGTRYLVAQDRFYVDFVTDNPFEALEHYADHVRLAQGIVLPVCRFPIVDTWFAQVPHFGGGEDRAGYRAQNDSVGAVEEMECVAKSGFLKYSPVGVLLEPDLYDPNNQQGWWDDSHWQRGPSNRAKKVGNWVSSHGQFVAPYETARKWVGAVKELGGIPMIYVQTGFRSQDYAEQFPGHMLFNESDKPLLNEKGEQQYRDKEKKQPRKLGYDYTDPDFIQHVREVWENLRLAGLQGVKFDYPDFPFTGWPTSGGMENQYSTTAMHYRNIFRLAKDGLGADSYIHERTLDRGSDVTLGLVTSQRTEGDTDRLTPDMISRIALRWYKNRVVVNYDMDGKNPYHAVPANRDGQRAMLTMSYVSAGTLMIVPSFGRMPAEMLHDLSRLYPFHAARQTARPVDAFTRECPQVYDFKVTPQWHQVTFFNADTNASADISVALAGDTADGALGLDPRREYYVYDFWNNGLVGKFPGSQRLTQTLRAGEARMMSIHEVEPNPQFLSSDRHLMQGAVDLLGCSWDNVRHQLRGVSALPGEEAVHLILAANGHQAITATVDEVIEHSVETSRVGAKKTVSTATLQPLSGDAGLIELTLNRSDRGPVAWTVTFAEN